MDYHDPLAYFFWKNGSKKVIICNEPEKPKNNKVNIEDHPFVALIAIVSVIFGGIVGYLLGLIGKFIYKLL